MKRIVAVESAVWTLIHAPIGVRAVWAQARYDGVIAKAADGTAHLYGKQYRFSPYEVFKFQSDAPSLGDQRKWRGAICVGSCTCDMSERRAS